MALFAWDNVVEQSATTLKASSQADGYGPEMLRIPIGNPAVAWQTPYGIATADLLISQPGIKTFRVFCLARTNLTPIAQMRVRIGSNDSMVEATPVFSTRPVDASFAGGLPGARPHTPAGAMASSWDSNGNLVEAAQNVARIDHDPVTKVREGWLLEPARTNFCSNPRLEGAAAGTPGTLPGSFATIFTAGGLSQQIVGLGTVGGLPAMDVRFFGTTTSGGGIYINLMSMIAGFVAGQRISGTLFVQGIAGILPTVSAVNLVHSTAAGTYVSESSSIGFAIPVGVLQTQRINVLATVPATATQELMRFVMFVATGTAYDFTVRIAAPQLEIGNYATSLIMPPAGTPGVSTRGAETPSFALGTTLSSASMYVETKVMAVADGGAVVAFALVFRPTNSGTDFFHFRLVNAASPYYNDVVITRTGSTGLDSGDVSGTFGAIRRNVVYQSASTVAYIANGTVVNSVPRLDIAVQQISVQAAEAVVYIRDIKVYSALSLGQATVLSSVGSTIGTPIYDSGFVFAGVVKGVGQGLHVLPARISGQAVRIDITDPSNPDLFLNIPLMFAGDGEEFSLSANSATEIRALRNDVKNRAGTVFVEALAKQRVWTVNVNYMLDDEITWLDLLESAAVAGVNVLMIPRLLYSRMAAETLYGLLIPGQRGFTETTGQARTWSGMMEERL